MQQLPATWLAAGQYPLAKNSYWASGQQITACFESV
jgi:hypothetical protein